METVTTLVGIGLIALAIAAAWLGAQLHGLRADLRAALAPSLEQRLARVTAQTTANARLVDHAEGRNALVDFVISEAAIIDFVEEVERRVEQNPKISAQQLRQEVSQDNRGRLERAKDYFRRNKGKIAEKVFGKINDLVKGMIPGAGSGSGGAV